MVRRALNRIGYPIYDGDTEYGRRNWGNLIRNAAKSAGIKPFGPHMLRHWFGSQLADAGVDLARIARVLGHSNPKLTFDVYLHYLDETPTQTGHRAHWRRRFGA